VIYKRREFRVLAAKNDYIPRTCVYIRVVSILVFIRFVVLTATRWRPKTGKREGWTFSNANRRYEFVYDNDSIRNTPFEKPRDVRQPALFVKRIVANTNDHRSNDPAADRYLYVRRLDLRWNTSNLFPVTSIP